MEVFNQEEFDSYIKQNFRKLISTPNSVGTFRTDIDGFCNSCNKNVYLKLHSCFADYLYGERKFPDVLILHWQCPRCKRKSFDFYIELQEENSEGDEFSCYRIFTLSQDNIDLDDIPLEFTSLRSTIREALFCMEHGKYVSSTIMFRRALEIIAKDVLGAKGNTLAKKLEWLKSNANNLNIDLSFVFHENASLIKNVGNQGAHPDDDIALHDFQKEDVDILHDLYLIIVSEIFVKPAKIKAVTEELKTRRKIK